MEPQEKLTTQQFIIDRLHDVQRKVENGNIQDALDELKEVKAADTKNIYIIALEKQILKLTDPNITPDFKQEVIKSLPPMIERAINDSQRRLAEKAQEPKDAKEKEAALEKLKSQYLHRADEYVEKGDYEHALEEIRRIYIIDPNNVVAKEYEQKIEQLAKLKAKGEEEKLESQQPARELAQQEPSEVEEKKGSPKILVIAAAVVGIIALGVWLLTSRSPQESAPQQEQQPIANEQQTQVQAPISEQKAQPTTKEQRQPETKQQPQQPSVKTEARSEQKQPIEQPKVTTPQPPQQQQSTPQLATQPEPKPQQTAQEQTSTPPPAPSAEEPPAPKPFVAIESPPQIVKRETPKYPEIAYRMRMEGKVIVEVTVDPQGKPIQAKIARSTSDVFNDAAIEAAMKSTYKPAMMSTGPVTAKVYVPFDFKLR
ncbi:MAG: TonB family protein [Bacteroidetes bacterium]|nr:TonB family protein [Bacteroidota bacterium]